MRWWMLTTHTMVIIPWSHISLLHPFNLHSVGCHLCLNKACRVGGQILICARSPLGGWPSPPLYDDIILYKFILLQRILSFLLQSSHLPLAALDSVESTNKGAPDCFLRHHSSGLICRDQSLHIPSTPTCFQYLIYLVFLPGLKDKSILLLMSNTLSEELILIPPLLHDLSSSFTTPCPRYHPIYLQPVLCLLTGICMCYSFPSHHLFSSFCD